MHGRICFALSLVLLAVSVSAAAAVVTITQTDVKKGNIPGTNGATGFPITIVKPGSYQLGSDLTIPANVDGIEINAPDVTLDLNGFTIHGPVTCIGYGPSLQCSGATSGSGVTSSRENITVRNGVTRGFGAYGVILQGIYSNTVEEIKASQNIGGGISAYGVIWKCTATFNGVGIVAGGSTVKGNVASMNLLDGIEGIQSVVTDNVAVNNGGFGIYGSSSMVTFNTGMFNLQGDVFSGAAGGTNNCSGSPC